MPKRSLDDARPVSERKRVRLWTAKEVAAALQLNEQTVYRLARAGEISCLRIGNKAIRFDLERVRDALEVKSRAREGSQSPASRTLPVPFVRLDDLRGSGEWTKPPDDLILERFKVPFPSKDLTRLAYDR